MEKANEGSNKEMIAKAEAALTAAGVGFIKLVHAPASTMELCEGIGEEYDARHCKNLFLTNRSGSLFVLLLMDPEKPYKTSDVSKKLGLSRLSFASAEQLERILGLTQGSVTVMGMVNECAKTAYAEGKLIIAMDKTLLERENICVHPNTNTATLVLKTRGVLTFLGHYGFECRLVEV